MTAALVLGGAAVAYALTLSPDSGPAGTTISYSGKVGSDASGPVTATVTLTGPGGVVASGTVMTDADCNVSGTITVPAGSPEGTYTLLVDASMTNCEGMDSGTFQVTAPATPTIPTSPTTPTTPTSPPSQPSPRGKKQGAANAAESITVTPSFTG